MFYPEKVGACWNLLVLQGCQDSVRQRGPICYGFLKFKHYFWFSINSFHFLTVIVPFLMRFKFWNCDRQSAVVTNFISSKLRITRLIENWGNKRKQWHNRYKDSQPILTFIATKCNLTLKNITLKSRKFGLEISSAVFGNHPFPHRIFSTSWFYHFLSAP